MMTFMLRGPKLRSVGRSYVVRYRSMIKLFLVKLTM